MKFICNWTRNVISFALLLTMVSCSHFQRKNKFISTDDSNPRVKFQMTRLTKFLKLSIGICVALALTLVVFFVLYRFDNYMFGWEAGIRWGETPFIANHFREATPNEKATMVADLISKGYFIGTSIEQVKYELGPSTGGYYNSDSNLTYTVYIDGETIWDIVFIVDHSSGNVVRILIYKRRNGLTRKILGAFMRAVDIWF